MKYFFLLFLYTSLSHSTAAQKQVFSYPFEMEKGMLQKSDYDAYFLDDSKASDFAFILKDNKKVEYVLVDKNFKIISKIEAKIDNTIFSLRETYMGGTADNGIFNFVYKVNEKNPAYRVEKVDFNAKSVENRKVFELSHEEKALTSFSDNNRYFSIAANNKTNELIVYSLTSKGDPITKAIPFTIPAGKNKNKNSITEYLAGLKVVKSTEEPGLESVVQSAKLFSSENSLVFVINDGDSPTHLFEIKLNDYSYHESFIDHTSLIQKEKSKSYVNSFLYDDNLFSLILNKKSIVVGIYDISKNSLLKSYEINEASNTGMFAQYPAYEERRGKKAVEKDVDDVRKLIKALTNGTEGITVNKNSSGQFIVTAGSYDPIVISRGGGGGGPTGSFSTPGVRTTVSGTPTLTGSNYITSYRPGAPSYTTTSATYYKTTYFKLLLDPLNFKTVKGKIPASVNSQIKDYMEESDKKAKATNQFALGTDQYYGYYDKEALAYVIEKIMIRK